MKKLKKNGKYHKIKFLVVLFIQGYRHYIDSSNSICWIWML